MELLALMTSLVLVCSHLEFSFYCNIHVPSNGLTRVQIAIVVFGMWIFSRRGGNLSIPLRGECCVSCVVSQTLLSSSPAHNA